MLFMYPQSMTNDVVEDVAEHDPLRFVHGVCTGRVHGCGCVHGCTDTVYTMYNVFHASVHHCLSSPPSTPTPLHSAHLDTMFAPDAPPLEWDDTRAYTRNNLDLFYLSHGATPLDEDQLTEALYGGWPADVHDEGPNAYGNKAARWRRIQEGVTLQGLLGREDYVVPGIPVVFVVARGTPYYDQFIQQVDQ